MGPTNFRWVGGSEYGGVWLREQAGRLGLRVWVKQSTDDLHNLSVQGPGQPRLLHKTCACDRRAARDAGY